MSAIGWFLYSLGHPTIAVQAFPSLGDWTLEVAYDAPMLPPLKKRVAHLSRATL